MTAPPTPEIAVLDLAGTTISDDGLVLDAFVAALADAGIPESDSRYPAMMAYIDKTMGSAKISVFLELFDNDRAAATRANQAFEDAYASRVGSGLATAMPGARAAIDHLHALGAKVALTTGFSPETRDALLTAVGWGAVADLVLSPADVGRGRPYPDLVLSALIQLGGSSVHGLLTAGDTMADIRCGLAAGARMVVGVLSGTHGRAELEGVGAHHILPSIADLPALLDGTQDYAASPQRKDR